MSKQFYTMTHKQQVVVPMSIGTIVPPGRVINRVHISLYRYNNYNVEQKKTQCIKHSWIFLSILLMK